MANTDLETLRVKTLIYQQYAESADPQTHKSL